VRRRPTIELLDSDSGTPSEVAESLQDLRWFNRWFGGIATSRKLIAQVVEITGQKELSLLEVAAGDGYVPLTLIRYFEAAGIRLDVTLLDRAASHLPRNGTMSKIGGDALRLPCADSSFDVISCSLFVHHFTPDQVVAFAREALRVATTAVLVHDLIRDPLHLALAYAGVPLYRSRLTRHDAPASVRQAYTIEEMRSFFRQAGAASVQAEWNYFFRMGIIAWRTRPTGT
jgi:ubiquinone/menaquinone biosynthesis C-methylase UbiE